VSEVQIWRIDVPSASTALAALAMGLTPDERQWAGKLAPGGPRERFIAGRGSLRRILGEQLGKAPAEVPLRTGPGGKPELDVPGAPAIHFSLSHSGAVVLIATAPHPIGVDLEGPRQLRHALEVAARSFARSELELVQRCPSGARPRRFLEIWTAKEAVLKASGAGLPGLEDVEVTPGPDGALAEADGAGAHWAVRVFEPAPGYVGAAASSALPDRIEVVPLRA
jgi:4'-phosphopantetheinyl transferase